MRKTGKGLLGALHLTTFSGSGIQFPKVSLKDGRQSYLAVAWEVEVFAIIDRRGAREEPLSDGLWNIQPESLSPAGLGRIG